MWINIALDMLNLCVIAYLLYRITINYKHYNNGLRNIRFAILLGTLFSLVSTLLLMTNSISNMFNIWERDYVFSHWEMRTALRLGITIGALVFLGIVNNSHFKFLTLEFWKEKLK